MNYAVMCPSLRWFEYQMRDRFDSEISQRRPGAYTLKNGDRYIYPTSLNRLRGIRPLKILHWGTPQFELSEDEIKYLEAP